MIVILNQDVKKYSNPMSICQGPVFKVQLFGVHGLMCTPFSLCCQSAPEIVDLGYSIMCKQDPEEFSKCTSL
jgi:hypothetical protein